MEILRIGVQKMNVLISLLMILNVFSGTGLTKDIRGDNILEPVRDPFTDDNYNIVYDEIYGVNTVVYSNGQQDIYFDAHGVPIDAETFLSMAVFEDNTSKKHVNKTRGEIVPGEPNSAVINSYYESYGTEYQVSPWAQNDYGGVTVSASVSITSNYSYTVNIGSQGIAKIITKIIDLGLEFNYQTSSETGYSVTFAVPQGKRGCIYFRPIYMNYNSLYIDYENYGHRTKIITPEKNGYFTNGIFRLVVADPI